MFQISRGSQVKNPTRSAKRPDNSIDNLKWFARSSGNWADGIPCWHSALKNCLEPWTNKSTVNILYLCIVDDDVFRSQRHYLCQTCSWHFDLQNKLERKNKKDILLFPIRNIVSVAVCKSLSKPPPRQQRERHQTKGLMGKTIAVHVRSW